MSLDCFASEPHYAEHLAPIAAAIPGARLVVADSASFKAAMDALLRLEARNGVLHRAEVPDYHSARPVLVASHRDLLLTPDTRRVALLEHGAGQTYVDAPESPSYAGGPGWDRAALILAPGPHSARHWRTAYPDTPVVELGGSPRLDPWANLTIAARTYTDELHRGDRPPTPDEQAILNRPMPPAPIAALTIYRTQTLTTPPAETGGTGYVRAREAVPVAVSFHWHCEVVPETRATFPFWQAAVARLAKTRRVVGHAHPRVWATLGGWYGQQGIPATRSFPELLDRCAGGLLICDNSSIMYEWAALGWPVLCLTDPRVYRDEVEHGLRFWRHEPGPECAEPDDLESMVEMAEWPSRGYRMMRDRAVAEAYGDYFDGLATARAVAAIEEYLL